MKLKRAFNTKTSLKLGADWRCTGTLWVLQGGHFDGFDKVVFAIVYFRNETTDLQMSYTGKWGISQRTHQYKKFRSKIIF